VLTLAVVHLKKQKNKQNKMKKSELRKIIRESINQLMTEQSMMGKRRGGGDSLKKAIANAKEQGFDFFSGEKIGGGFNNNSLKEQTQNPDCRRIYVKICDGVQSNTNFGEVPLGACVLIDGNTPQVGDQWVAPATLGNQQAGGVPMYTGYAGMNIEVTQVLPPSWWAMYVPWMITSVSCPGSTPCTVYGCTDPTAMNYNATILPNCDQGCVYAGEIGCTDSTASNYDPAAIYDDGSCITAAGGCDPSAWSNHANWTSTLLIQ
jgi:hypothetical protein